MLAYVFWHQPEPGVPAREYEALLAAFHEALATSPPSGFEQSWAYRVAGAPWTPPGEPAYEDWYLLRDAAALDPLNQAAVSGARRPHDVVAARARWGAAGLYLLRRGAPAFAGLRQAAWLAKPAGERYDAFYDRIRREAGPGPWALWGRQMVLGPTPEFCFHGGGGVQSAAMGVSAVTMDPIWQVSSHS